MSLSIVKTTPLFVVDAIPPHLGHWRDKLGYQVVVEVPHGEHLGFVILARDKSEIMLQTVASIQDDLPALLPTLKKKPVAFFHEVKDLEAVIATFSQGEIKLGPRITDYGMREIWITDSEGLVHGYAERA